MELEQQVMHRVMRRIMPVLIISYFISYLDRSNLSIAALTMIKDLGLSASDYGFAAGIFFLGYVAFEIPSNILLTKFGARVWIARIMFTWGVLSGCMALAVGPNSLYALRVILGIAEAGLFPGLIYYISFWFPAAYRARAFGYFLIAIPLSIVFGSPIGAAILYMDGIAGLAGWQWLFIIEAIPAVAFSVFLLFYLTDTPAQAAWLTPAQRAWLIARLEKDTPAGKQGSHGHGDIAMTFKHPKVWLLSLINVALIACSYGCVFFLPLIVSGYGFSKMQTGLITALPFLAGAIGMVLCGRSSDRRGEIRWHFIVPLLVAAFGFAIAASFNTVTGRMIGLGLAACGTFASLPAFWTIPATFLKGTSAATGIALINTIGSLAGFGAPYMMGWVKQHTGQYDLALLAIGASALVAAVLALRIHAKPPQAVRMA